jgi:tetratricopeptide (TPR) repeat protein
MASLTAQLEQMENAQLVRRLPYEDLAYLFKHALTHDAVYESTLKADRRIVHRIVGEILERVYPEQTAQLAPVLGSHFAAAGEPERARKYFMLAGNRALAGYANAEAEHHFRAALSFAAPDAERAPLLAGLGEALFGQSRYEEAIRVWREAIVGYQALGKDMDVARLYARLARAAWHAGDFRRGLALAREGLAAVAEGPPTLGMTLLLHEAGRACMFNLNISDGLSFCRQALAMAEQLADLEAQADILITLGMLLEPARELDQSIEVLSRAAELAVASNSLAVASRAYHNLGQHLYCLRGDLQAGRDHLLQAAEICQRRGSVAEEFHSLCYVALATCFLGDFTRAELMLATLRKLWHSIPDPLPYQTWLRTVEVLLPRYRGELTDSIPLLRSCFVQARQAGRNDWLYEGFFLFAELLLESGEVQEAGQVAMDYLEMYAQVPWGGAVTARCLLSAVCLREGRIEEARHWLAEAREKFDHQITAFEAEHLSLAEARLATAEKRWPEVIAAFEATTQAQARMGKRWYRAQTLREWGEAYLARDEPGDSQRACGLLREALAEFEAMDLTKYAVMVTERLQTVYSIQLLNR